MTFMPIDPALFGDPFPRDHPWAAHVGYGGWEVQGTRRVHVVYGGRCTLCRRGLPDCYAMRMTDAWRRSTCARCISAAVMTDETAARAIASLQLRSRDGGALRLGRAIAWWRMCGAVATDFPGYLDAFFLPCDRVPPFRRAEVRP